MNEGKSTVTIAHLSDPHLTTPQIGSVRDLAGKRLLGYLSWLKGRRFRHQAGVLARVVADMQAHAPRHTLVSGDLTHLGLAGEFEQALAWLQSLGDAREVSVVLGNHERYANDAHWQAVSHWQPYIAGDDLVADAPTLRIRDHVAIIGVNTSEPSAPLLATGRVGEQQAAALAECLAQQNSRFRIVVMHHSPLPDGHARRKRLVDADTVMSVLRDVGAELVVHGHGHRSSLTTVDGARGQTCIICAPSASLARDGLAGWNAYAVTQTQCSWTLALELRRHRTVSPHMTTEAQEHFTWARPL